MIGKYKDEEFIKELTVTQQREYLTSLVKGMTNEQAKELYDIVNKARFKALRKVKKKDYNNPNVVSHFWDKKVN